MVSSKDLFKKKNIYAHYFSFHVDQHLDHKATVWWTTPAAYVKQVTQFYNWSETFNPVTGCSNNKNSSRSRHLLIGTFLLYEAKVSHPVLKSAYLSLLQHGVIAMKVSLLAMQL